MFWKFPSCVLMILFLSRTIFLLTAYFLNAAFLYLLSFFHLIIQYLSNQSSLQTLFIPIFFVLNMAISSNKTSPIEPFSRLYLHVLDINRRLGMFFTTLFKFVEFKTSFDPCKLRIAQFCSGLYLRLERSRQKSVQF